MIVTADPIRAKTVPLWRELGPGKTYGPLRATHAGITGCDPLLDRLNALTGAIPGDTGALAILHQLGFVVDEFSDDGQTLTYRLVEEEPPVDTRPLIEREQAVIDEIHRRELRMRREEEDHRERVANQFPSMATQVREFVEASIAEAMQDIKTTIDAAVEAALARREAASNHETGHAPEMEAVGSE